MAAIAGQVDCVCASLDLSELKDRSVAEGVLHSCLCGRVFESIEFGALAVVAVLHGAVAISELELAVAAHPCRRSIHVFVRLPKGRGICFSGGMQISA